MVYAARRMGICMAGSKAKPPRKHDRRYPELLRPGEKVQTTMDTYSHLYPNKQVEVARQLDGIMP